MYRSLTPTLAANSSLVMPAFCWAALIKSLEVGQKILDYMGSTGLIANLFRISQTEEKLRKDEISGAKAERKCVALLKR